MVKVLQSGRVLAVVGSEWMKESEVRQKTGLRKGARLVPTFKALEEAGSIERKNEGGYGWVRLPVAKVEAPKSNVATVYAKHETERQAKVEAKKASACSCGDGDCETCYPPKEIAAPIIDGVRDHYDATTLIVEGLGSFGVGFIPVGQEARREFQGPMVPGPWAYAYAQATVLDNNGGSAAVLAREEAEGRVVRARVNDKVRIGGFVFKIFRAANNNICLEK